MKRIFTSMTLLLLSIGVFAQDPIKNFSFENWTTNANNKAVPVDWDTFDEDLDANAVRKHTSGSQGSSALYIGSYNDGADVVGADVYTEDNLTSVPASLSFDYIIQNNNNSIINGLIIEVYFYDINDDLIEDYVWNSEMLKNNPAFKSGVLNFNPSVIANAKRYEIDIYYLNFGGTTSEYGVIDNLKFRNTGGNVSVQETANSTINFYPNPATNALHFTTSNNETIDKILVTAVDGRQSTFSSNTFTNNTIDISELANGVYFISAYGTNGRLINNQKVLINK